MKGYKVFNPDWTCRNYQFEVGKTFEEDVNPKCCSKGFHFCTKLADCFSYYKFDPNNKVAEVEAVGDIDTNSSNTKCSTNKLHIVREITWHEVLELVNSGKFNSGICNTGYFNSGNRNTGDFNSGDFNTGDRNSGNFNTGNRNTGDWNSGDYNSGDYNTGDWNKTSSATGCFNTERQKLKFFDKETDMTMDQWFNSDARHLLNQIDFKPTDWITSKNMTDEEKAAHPEHETTGGYLKVRNNTDCCTEWWNELSDNAKEIIMEIPNFDKDIFYEITGIEVQNDSNS